MSEGWRERWREGRIGFHLPDVHPALREFGPTWLAGARRVLVPLSGKSRDLLYLAKHAADGVAAVELVPEAVEAFYAENSISFDRRKSDDFMIFQSDQVTTYCGDIFNIDKEFDAGHFDRIYDRAALVALPSDARRRYASRLAHLLSPDGSMLLVSVEYDPTAMSGPPYAVTGAEIAALYGERCRLEVLDTQDDLPPRFAERGVRWLREVTYLLRSRA